MWSADDADAPWAQSRALTWLTGIGRLRQGVTLAQAETDLNRVQTYLASQYPDTDRDVRVRVTPLKDTVVGDSRASLWLLFGSVSVLLLIACTNIAALLLSRAANREQEIAVRYSLGVATSRRCSTPDRGGRPGNERCTRRLPPRRHRVQGVSIARARIAAGE